MLSKVPIRPGDLRPSHVSESEPMNEKMPLILRVAFH